MLLTRLIPQLNCPNPVRVVWRGAAGIVTARHVRLGEPVEKYEPLCDIGEGELCTADAGGLLHWVARVGTRIATGDVVAVIANDTPITDTLQPRRGWVHTSDVLPAFTLPPTLPPALPVVEEIELPAPSVVEEMTAPALLKLPFDVSDKSVRKTYYLSEKESAWLEGQGAKDKLNEKPTNVLRVAVAAFASLSQQERLDWMDWWKKERGVN